MTPPRFSIGLTLVAVLVCGTPDGAAQGVEDSLAHPTNAHGSGDDGMPGIVRADSALELPKGIALSVSSSYGFTGKTLEDGDTHHRGAGRLAVAYALSRDFSVALRMDGRYDKHFLDAGGDDGWVGDPRIMARYRLGLGSSLNAGVQLGLWAPGSNAPSIEFDALSAEAVVALTWAAPGNPIQVTANAGYRLDRSAASVSEPERLSLSDRMSLGVSDYNAVLAAVGVSYDIGPVEALAEWSLDLLHGSGAPAFGSSPMRVALGARHELSNGWYLFGTSEFRVSKVRTDDVAEELLPFDPRISVLAGLQLRFGHRQVVPAPVPVVEEKKEPEPEPVVPTDGPVSGRIASGETPIAEAQVVLVDAKGVEHTTTTDAKGVFTLEKIALGEALLKVIADGYQENEQTVTVSAKGVSAEFDLQAILPPGQLRGRVRSFRGQGLASELTVEPGSESISTDAQGNFELDLPPGEYEVTIVVDGFKAQTRKIRIDENGVTILNVDMRKRDRKRGGR